MLVVGVRTRRLILSELDGNIGQPDLPYVNTGEPRRADGAASNTPPKFLDKNIYVYYYFDPH